MTRHNAGKAYVPQRQRGLAAVEMAIVLPVLLLLMLGVTEIGRILFQYNAINKTSRDAVRYLAKEAIVGSTDVLNVSAIEIQRTKNLAVYGNTYGTGQQLLEGLAPGNVQILVVDPLHVAVDIQITYVPLLGPTLPSFGFGGGTAMGINLRASAVMRAL